MNTILIIVIGIWIVGACVRAYKQARFYQIEEYMSLRYLRWLTARRERWLPNRPAIAFVVSAAISLVLSESQSRVVPAAISVIAAVIASLPEGDGEVKKAFRPTARAKRMLGTAFVVCAAIGMIGLGLIGQLPFALQNRFEFTLAGAAGLLTLLLAPLALIAGNLLMTPVEAMFRRRFISSARNVLEEINPTVIGITGSYGKTSTKHYLSHILNGRFHAYPTPKSYNTMMGVCIAINNDLAKDRRAEYFICEMGAYIPGEIARIASLTKPRISVVVEVGPQHLERFGSLENVAIAKYEIIKALPPDGIGVFNWDNPYVREMYERNYPQTRIAVSKTISPDAVPAGGPRLVATQIAETLDGLTFNVIDTQTGETVPFSTALLGEHNVTNILLSAAIAQHEGMSLKEIAARVRGLQPAESRLVRQTTPTGITILNDAYSANPVGIVSALKALSLHQTGRRLLITPGMVELGDLMEKENQRLGEIAAQHATDVILVGSQQTAPILAGLKKANFPPDRMQTVETLSEAVEWYKRNLSAGDTVLFLNDLPDTYSS